ncbi:MAG: hypothetical protein IT158_02985 [Bryobacterales bacterium]|nr:hypothetical protein [Bryobacterales bacterium]
MKLVLPIALALLLPGCNRGLETKEAVRQAVVDYLAERSNLNVSSMNIEVVSVAFRGNEADATVSFQPKGGGAQGMEMRYSLEKQGNRWVVKGRGSGHAGQGMGGGTAPGAMPPGHPPATGEQKK